MKAITSLFAFSLISLSFAGPTPWSFSGYEVVRDKTSGEVVVFIDNSIQGSNRGSYDATRPNAHPSDLVASASTFFNNSFASTTNSVSLTEGRIGINSDYALGGAGVTTGLSKVTIRATEALNFQINSPEFLPTISGEYYINDVQQTLPFFGGVSGTLQSGDTLTIGLRTFGSITERGNRTIAASLTPVPEPASLAVIGMGLVALRKRRNKSS